jgi:putative ABC transport system ATP-binding protein
MIELERLGKTFGSGPTAVPAVRDVDLKIERGDFVTIMGPSGSGKSTLLHLLGLIETPSGGNYRLEGREVGRLGDAEKARLRGVHFGFIFQSFQLFPELDALQNVLLPMSYTRSQRRPARLRAEELLETLGLGQRLRHLPGQLSGGEQQRVAIARALANDPDLILADEPTGNLPHHTGEEIMAILRNLNRLGVTLVVVTHDPAIGAQGRTRLSMADGVLS